MITILLMGSENLNFILRGAGATFPHPLYEKWISVYEKIFDVRITYEAIGSGEGIKVLREYKVDFGATDAFLSEKEMAEMKTEILHVPTCLGAVVIIYNLPGKPILQLTPQLISDIFLGKITRWSDKKIAKVNPRIILPDLKITVVHRSESSGTTFIFSNYLSSVSNQWKEKVGAGKIVNWPIGIGIEKNPGLASLVKKIEGTVGYVEHNFAVQGGLPTAQVKNKSGNFVKADMATINKASQFDLPKDTRTLIIDTSAPHGYPISAFTWLIFYKEQNYHNRSLKRAQTLAQYLWWVIHDGQKYNNLLNYGTLSPQAVRIAENIIQSMTFDGKPIDVGKCKKKNNR